MKSKEISNNIVFSKEDTKVIKGVAIVLMLMHHLWIIPDRIAGGELNYLLSVFGESSLSFFGWFGNICVSLFFFLGGYGIYVQSTKKDFNLIKNIKKLFISYWKVFLIFIPIAFIFFSNQVPYTVSDYSYARYNVFTWTEVLQNFFTISYSLNGEWWFLSSYLVAIISFPIIKMIIDKFNYKSNILIVIFVLLFGTYIFPALGNISTLGNLNTSFIYYNFLCKSFPWMACFWLGAVFAKDNLIIGFYNKIKNAIHLNLFVDVLAILSIIFLRQKVIGAELDILYTPVLVVLFMDLLNRLKIVRNIFAEFGNRSTNMYLIHSFYCYYFALFAKITTYFKWGISCLLVLIIMTYVSAVLLDYFWNGIEKLFKKVFVK
ncbi:MAG: acyltransferase [Firmicutes bacterium]|nr:acyltransferase [Bacillota bacterium]